MPIKYFIFKSSKYPWVLIDLFESPRVRPYLTGGNVDDLLSISVQYKFRVVIDMHKISSTNSFYLKDVLLDRYAIHFRKTACIEKQINSFISQLR